MNNDDVIKRATAATKLVVFMSVLCARSKNVVIPQSFHTHLSLSLSVATLFVSHPQSERRNRGTFKSSGF